LTARRAPCPERAGGPEISSKDYADEGKSYDEALKAALAPMKGKTLLVAPELSDRAFEEYANKTGDAGFKLQVLDDAKSLVLAKAGREEGAPIVYTFVRQDGRISSASRISSSTARGRGLAYRTPDRHSARAAA
jgi:hypothetical protein